MSNTISYFTKDGFEKLKEELHHLKTKGRADMAKQIQEARDKGDLSENAEYDAAKDAQGMLEMQIARLEQTLATARVMDESQIDLSKVQPLTTVRIKNMASGMEMKYTLVAEKEADFKAGKISIGSPIGKGLLGLKVGDVAEVQVPSGLMRLEILEITLS
ncbi:MAG: transcription elongation factor GreA [Sphingomonadales bacterium]|nr:transcription elongation factor GreA [Sphingomonadales bacterium]